MSLQPMSPGPDPGACPTCGCWRKAGMIHRCDPPAATPDPPCAHGLTGGRGATERCFECGASVPAASPDERLREALREIVAAFPSPPGREMDDEEIEKWYADHGDWFQRLAALAAADREAPDEECHPSRWCVDCQRFHPPVSDEQEKP